MRLKSVNFLKSVVGLIFAIVFIKYGQIIMMRKFFEMGKVAKGLVEKTEYWFEAWISFSIGLPSLLLAVFFYWKANKLDEKRSNIVFGILLFLAIVPV